jgi:hypothetical protein
MSQNEQLRETPARNAVKDQSTKPDVVRHEDPQPAWWNPWHWPTGIRVLVVGAFLLMLPFAIRTAMLSTVPDMEEPFDVAEFVKWDVPPEKDAFTDYRQAAEIRTQITAHPTEANYFECYDAIMTKGWTEADEPIKKMLDANHEALDVWRRGTEKDRALNVSPDKPAHDLDISFSFIPDQRHFVRLAWLEAVRCIHDGDLDQAWNWLRAAHRSGGHMTHRGCMLAGLIGTAFHDGTVTRMSHWAEQPTVTPGQLKRALAELKSDYALYESESNMLKAEYLWYKNMILQPDWIDNVDFLVHSELSGVQAAVKMGLWVVGEPDLTMRISRQILANQIREVDRPLASRRKLAGTGIAMLFDPDPSVPSLPGQLDPAAIDRGINRSFVARQLLPTSVHIDKAIHRQHARQATIEIVLAAQAYRRDHGEFPKSLQELVLGYLTSVPTDPCDPLGGPVKYRREEPLKAVVWSVGNDGSDGGGDVDNSNREPTDVGFLLK